MLALTSLLLLLLSPPAAGTPTGGVRGEGSGILVMPPFTGDRVSILIVVPALPGPAGPGRALGQFDVTHLDKFGREFARLAGAITCVEVHGTTAFMTGAVERGHAPDAVGDPVGQVLPITVADHGTGDLAGLAPPSHLTPPCAPVPLNTVIDQGDFRVSGGA